MNAKKLWALTAVLALCLTAFLNAAMVSAQVDEPFSDVPFGYDYVQAVEYLKDAGAIEGYEDGTYRPVNIINRAEFVKIVLEAQGIQEEGGNCFPDVTDQWFAPYVCKAKELGLVQGYPDGTFKPERPINFVESGKVVAEGLDLPTEDGLTDNWYHKYVKAVEDDKAIPTSIDTFDQYLNRGEMAEMVWRVKTGQNEESNTYGKMKVETQAQYLTNFSSCDALINKFEELGSNYYGGDYYIMEEQALPAMAPSDSKTTTAGGSRDEAGSVSYSETNVQVQGVDEADFVKTDGQYIYIVKNGTIRVVKAYQPSEMKELDAIEFSDTTFQPSEMYVDNDKLVVIGTTYYSYPYPLTRTSVDAEMIAYPYYGGDQTVVYIFDIADKTDISIFRKMTFEGSYNQSRKIDDMVYLVMNRYGFWPYDTILKSEEILPRVLDDGDTVAQPLVGCGDIKYAPVIESSNFLIVVGIPIQNKGAELVKEVILGQSDNIYASQDNLYVASANWNYYQDNETTNVYKFSLSPDDISYIGKGKVPGRILNQFSMDEDGDYFRIATTRGFSWSGESDNNVYVLDGEMNMIGKLEGIAPGEEIYSTRFVGDRLYMVTFKKIDPFFVIDLSNPSFPDVLGKLKIPGYSDYLHPYDENHILGFGKETVDPTELEAAGMSADFAWYQGMKVALFDVTDVNNPKEMYKVIIGDRGTDSPLLYDHKALLFDKEKNLIAFPVKVAEIPEELKDPDLPSNTYGDFVFQGAYVYGLDLAKGFTLKATISHYNADEVAKYSGYYWYGPKDIERLLYIGNYLYTVSKGMVKANDMTNNYSETNSVEVGPPEGEYYDYLIY